jgi:hypothetical protein
MPSPPDCACSKHAAERKAAPGGHGAGEGEVGWDSGAGSKHGATMASNLLIAYDVGRLHADETAITETINALGEALQLLDRVWYVASAYSASDAADLVRVAMEGHDRLVVVDAGSDDVAWFNLASPGADSLNGFWHKGRAA